MEHSSRILIVDDEVRLGDSVKRLLGHKGYAATTANSVAEALRCLAERPFDLVLLDLMLPDANGMDIFHHLKENYPKTQVIIMTAHGTIEAAVTAVKEGAFDFLKKPFEFEVLLKRVENAIDKKRLAEEKERINRELQLSQQRYQYVVQNSPDIIYILDEQGNFSFVNEAFEHLLGYSSTEILGRHYTCVLDPKDWQRSQYVFNERRSANRSAGFSELRLKLCHGKNGPGQGASAGASRGGEELFPIELKAQGLYEEAAGPGKKAFRGTYGVARDIRDRKLLETHLQQAEKLESLRTLAGGIAHDFNNFLAAILGNITLVKLELKQEAGVSQRLAEMEKAVLRAKDLTKQLLSFALGGAPVKKSGPLTEVIRDVSQFALSGSNVRCLCDFPADLWKVEFDEGQISQVINNLTMNAIEAMPEGGCIEIRGLNFTVTPSCHLPLHPGRYLRVAFKDTGQGIAREILSKIFDPFFTTKKNGSGLGLSTSYSIMKNHGGYLEVESEAGKGATFFLFFPASENEGEEVDRPQEELYRGTGRVLIMEDEEQVADVCRRMLSYLGYAAEAVQDGESAVQAYSQALESEHPFRLAIIDLTIPGGMGGKEAAQKMLAIDPKAVLIAASGHLDCPIMRKPLHYGFKDIISKPFTLRTLSKILWHNLNPAHDQGS